MIRILPFLFFLFPLTASPRVEVITPPKLNPKTVESTTYCTRPMRDGKFNISCEKIGEKMVVNCYGHGGSGWTTLFGSVEKAIEEMEKMLPTEKRSKPIRIIGAGCVGLTTACELVQKGYIVSGISADELYDLPSWRAAGYFALVSVKTSPEEQERLNRMGLNTFLTYRAIEKGEHPYISASSVRFLPVYCSAETDSGIDDLVARGFLPPREEVTLDFGNGVKHENFYKYITYFMDTTNIMKQLYREIARHRIHITLEKVHAFSEIDEEIVFNCSGLGAKELNEDEQMIAVRGHLGLLNERSGHEHMDYMIYTKVGPDDYVYMFPRCMSVTAECPEGKACYACIGGTFIPHTDKLTESELEELDRKEFKQMFDRNCQFFHGTDYTE